MGDYQAAVPTNRNKWEKRALGEDPRGTGGTGANRHRSQLRDY